MKVLVGTPVMRGQLMTRAWLSWYRLDWDGQLDYYQAIGGDYAIQPYDNIVRKYNQIKQVVLSNGYDALLTVESDMILPRDALTRLAKVDADVAYGVYVWKHGFPFWTCYIELSESYGKPISIDPERVKTSWGKVVESEGVGHGCTLIHRHVLEAIEFQWSPGEFGCCDWHMSVDCKKLGFTQKHDLGVVCGHISNDPVHRILWPDPNAKGLYRAQVLERWPDMKRAEQKEKWFTGIDISQLADEEGRVKVKVLQRFHLKGGVYKNPGEVFDAEKSVAERLIRNGVAEPIKKPKRKRRKAKEDTPEVAEEQESGWKPLAENARRVEGGNPCPPCDKKKGS